MVLIHLMNTLLFVPRSSALRTYQEYIKKLEEVRGIILKTRNTISEMDEKYVDFKDKYLISIRKHEDAG